MRLRISIRGSVRPSVRRSVRPWSVRPSRVFFKSRKSRGNDIESLENKIWQINLTNLTNLSDKSILVPHFRRIFVRTNLFFLIPLYMFNEIQICTWANPMIFLLISFIDLYDNPNLYFGSYPSFLFPISSYTLNEIQICTLANPRIFLFISFIYMGKSKFVLWL